MILLKIAICDDNLLFMKKLERILNENLDYIDIKIFLNVYDLLEQIESYDILFLDYEMPLLNGIEILEKIKNNSIRKIMISNYDNIVFSTYEYNLYWFVRKTHLDNDIHRMFNKLKKDLVNENKKLKIHSYNKSLILAFDEIIYIETEGNYICIVTKNQKYRIRSTFHSIVKQFDNLFFIMPTYGVLINMKYIKYIDFHNSEIMLYNEYKIRISRSKKEEVKKQYAQFIAK